MCFFAHTGPKISLARIDFTRIQCRGTQRTRIMKKAMNVRQHHIKTLKEHSAHFNHAQETDIQGSTGVRGVHARVRVCAHSQREWKLERQEKKKKKKGKIREWVAEQSARSFYWTAREKPIEWWTSSLLFSHWGNCIWEYWAGSCDEVQSPSSTRAHFFMGPHISNTENIIFTDAKLHTLITRTQDLI